LFGLFYGEANNIFMRLLHINIFFKTNLTRQKKIHNNYYLYKMFFIKYTLDSTRTDYTKNVAITDCTKKITVE